jgi:phage recombination protein Bet
MNQVVKIEEGLRKSIIPTFAAKYGMDPGSFEITLRSILPANSTWEQFSAFLIVANQYNLNPITKEIYAFPTRAGGIQPIVSIDGWMNLINSHPKMNGMEFVDVKNGDGKLSAITCRIYRKDRDKPTEVTEYMAECVVASSEPWKKWPARMLRHKAAIQCARYAFGFSGIVEEDEFHRAESIKDITPPPAPKTAPPVQIEQKEPDAATDGAALRQYGVPEAYEDGEAAYEAGKTLNDMPPHIRQFPELADAYTAGWESKAPGAGE